MKKTRPNHTSTRDGKVQSSYPGDKDTKRDKTEQSKMRWKSKTNDPAWYAADPAILRDVASIPFSWASGTSIDLNGAHDFPKFISFPGLQVQYLYPAMGYSDGPSSPINVAAHSVYTFVRHANAGHANYDAPDLMIYILAMSQVYSYINYLQRMYGMLTLYSQRNRYLPDALISYSGGDPKSLREHYADFRYGINLLINKAASFAVPGNMSLFKRQAFLYQNVYTEGTSAKDQLYMYSPLAFWKYVLNTDSSGKLAIVKLPTVGTYDALLQFGNDLLAPLLASEDMNIMSGDILKAYGNEGIIRLASLPDSYPLVPIFDIGVLEQMKNATVIPEHYLHNGEVVQSADHSYLNSNWYIGGAYDPQFVELRDELIKTVFAGFGQNKVLTTTTSEVNPDLVIESTRLMVGLGPVQIDQPVAPYVSAALYCGTEIVAKMLNVRSSLDAYGNIQGFVHFDSIYYYSLQNDLGSNKVHHITFKNGAAVVNQVSWSDSIKSYLSQMRMSSAFRYFPWCEYDVHENKEGGGTGYYERSVWFDADNYAVLTSQDLYKMHEAAIINMLNAPYMAK